jgi:hypothetical protein
MFHDNCIKKWLCNFSSKCPVCRFDQRDKKID